MFRIGDHIVYKSQGVCEIVDIVTDPFGENNDRTYYVMKTLYKSNDIMIYTPVDKENPLIRPVMSKEEMKAFMDEMPKIPPMEIDDEKRRKECYKEAIATLNPVEYVRVLKAIYRRRQELSYVKRKTPESENCVERQVRYCLQCEMAVVLGVPLENAESTVSDILYQAC